MVDIIDINKAREILNKQKVSVDNRMDGNNLLEDTGVWIDFNYDDLKSHPPESEAYYVKCDTGEELMLLWDSILMCWATRHHFIVKWLREEK